MRVSERKRMPNWAIGLALVVVLAVGSYLAFTKNVPWGGGTEVTAVFNSAQNLRTNSPVRIAGVEVGKVTDVEPLAVAEDSGETDVSSGNPNGSGAVVTMEIDDEGLPLKEDSTFELKPRLFLEGLDAIFAAGPGNFRAVEAPADNVAALLYTSGTTADPKGVMLTHANLLGEVNAVFGLIQIGSSDALLGILPMFHVLAQMANLLLPLVKGARVVYLETLNTTELLRGLQERQITAFCVVPQFFYLIHERIFKEVAKRGRLAESFLRSLMRVNLFLRRFHLNAGPILFGKIHKTFGSKMRYLFTGGSRFDPAIARDFQAFGIDLLNAYGLTETSGGAFVNLPGHVIIGSVGPPLPTVEAKILDPQPQEEGGQPVGEIVIRGPIVMKGYWNRPDATAESLRDGWLHTGDLGYFDSDNNLFITGRRKEVIVLANGKNIYPEEIETHYLKSPAIKEICVMGLEAKPGDPVPNACTQ